jgi:hypothetical protein
MKNNTRLTHCRGPLWQPAASETPGLVLNVRPQCFLLRMTNTVLRRL